jgi:hypothetical protein
MTSIKSWTTIDALKKNSSDRDGFDLYHLRRAMDRHTHPRRGLDPFQVENRLHRRSDALFPRRTVRIFDVFLCDRPCPLRGNC